MNKLQGEIINIETSGNISIVTTAINDTIELKAIVIETPASATYLKAGGAIVMLFKETEVVMGTDVKHAISLQNKIPGTIKEIEQGALLSKIILESSAGEITALISTNAVHQLDLKTGQKAVAMVKLNEIMIQAL